MSQEKIKKATHERHKQAAETALQIYFIGTSGIRMVGGSHIKIQIIKWPGLLWLLPEARVRRV